LHALTTRRRPRPHHSLARSNKVLQAARCDEGFTLRDLMRPDRTRVLRILSALINLQKFRADKLAWYEELEARKTDLAAKKAAVLARQEEVRARIAQEHEARVAEQPAIDAVTAQRRELQEQLQRLRARDEAARAATSAQRQDILAVREAKKELQLQLEAAREEVEARRAQVVASPARLKAEIVTLETLVEQEQRAVDELDAQKRVLSRQLEVVAKAEKDVNKALLLMGEAEAEAKKLKLVIKDEKQRKVESEAVGAEVEALRAQAENALAHRRRAEDKLREARDCSAQRCAALARAIDVTRREAADFGEELKAAVDSRRAAEAEKMRLERQQSALTARHSQEVAEMIGTMKHFAASVASYDAGLLSQLAGVEAVEIAPPGRS
jgi:kinetochore protein Nuf2